MVMDGEYIDGAIYGAIQELRDRDFVEIMLMEINLFPILYTPTINIYPTNNQHPQNLFK